MKVFSAFLGAYLLLNAQQASAAVHCNYADGAGTFASVTIQQIDGKEYVRMTKKVGDSFLTFVILDADSGKIEVSKKNQGLGAHYINTEAQLSLSFMSFVGFQNTVESALIGGTFKDVATGKAVDISGNFTCHQN